MTQDVLACHTISRTDITATTKLQVLISFSATLCVILCGFSDLLLHSGDVLTGIHRGGQNDLTEWFIRSSEFSTGSSTNHEWPLWNPFLAMGQPHVGNPQSALYYPPNWLFPLFDIPVFLSWLLVVHHLSAAFGCLVLGRNWGLRWSSSVLSGVGFGLAPYLIAQTAEGHYAQIAAIAWIPWTFVAYERFRQRGGLNWIPISACLSLSFFAGHVQETLYLIMLLSAVITMEATRHVWRKEFQRSVTLLACWLLTGVVMVGLVAIDLVPIWSVSRLSTRVHGLDLAAAGTGLCTRNVQQLVFPFAHGPPGTGDDFWETLFHFGTILSTIAFLGAFLRWDRRGVRIMVFLFLIATLFAFGNQTPFFNCCYRLVPGVAAFRMPSRMLFCSSFCVAMLAGFGFDAITDKLRTLASRFQRWQCRLSFEGLTVVLLALVSGELCMFAHQVLATIPRQYLRGPSRVSEFFTRQVEFGRVLADQFVYSDREAVRDQVLLMRAYEPVRLLRFAGLFEAMTNNDASIDLSGYQPLQLGAFRKSGLDLAGVHYVVTVTRQSQHPGWKLVEQGHVPGPVSLRGHRATSLPFWIYKNESPLPRAFVQGCVTTCSDWPLAIRALKNNDSRRSIILSEDRLGPGPRSEFRAAKIVEYTPNRVIIDVECHAAGYAVLTDLYHPGWIARIGDANAPVIPVNFGFRGVPIPAGRHRIVMQYVVPGFRVGAGLTGITIVSLLLLMYRRNAISQ